MDGSVVQCLPSMKEFLGLILSTGKGKRQREEEDGRRGREMIKALHGFQERYNRWSKQLENTTACPKQDSELSLKF